MRPRSRAAGVVRSGSEGFPRQPSIDGSLAAGSGEGRSTISVASGPGVDSQCDCVADVNRNGVLLVVILEYGQQLETGAQMR